MPKRLILIGLYMIFIFIVVVAEMKYAKMHPIDDEKPQQQTQQKPASAK